MSYLVKWLREQNGALQPTRSMARNATRHLSNLERKKLFSPDIEQMRTAEGRWYEAIIYEMFRDITHESDQIKMIALKGADAPRGRRNVRLGQNGLYYSRCGDITIRGNGQDLAEFDLLLVDQDGSVAFGEVVTSPSDMKEFEKEIEYKKKLLGYLFDQERVPFMLISSLDISHYSVVRRLLKSSDNVNIQTISCEEIKSLMNRNNGSAKTGKATEYTKALRATDIPLKRPFDYQKYHDCERNRVFAGIANQADLRSEKKSEGTAVLVKKILWGGLYPSAIKSLCKDHEIWIRGERLEFRDVMNYFTKVILATDLPDYESLVYMRSKYRREYLKMVQDKSGNFKFERITPPKVGFFLWLESICPSLGSKVTSQILDAFSPSSRLEA
ncbi:MAG: hypothetical protein LUQ45_00880 [Methanoregulaceae archaeon]|nr:hypothetical protein [Methanoregulaceae archaeon]